MTKSRGRTKGDSGSRAKAGKTSEAPVPDARRKRRSRPVPRWLSGSTELDGIAQRRCLMILSVLSGERPVTEVIEDLSISRGTYYNLEQRALTAMLSALVPGASSDAESSSAIPAKRIAELEEKVSRLEREKRRAERALYLTRQILGRGAVTLGVGRPKKREDRPVSTKRGRDSSSSSPRTTTPKEASKSPKAPTGSARSSTPESGGSSVSLSTSTPDGVDER